ncbi:hypothetical protein F4808DRAFT_467429 [Astrocystis sublimbata]|nr:hypothetical protein F4808DRAFT_467429 [Astrocystis sublimbata]
MRYPISSTCLTGLLATLSRVTALPAASEAARWVPGTEKQISSADVNGTTVITSTCRIAPEFLQSRNVQPPEESGLLQKRNRNLCGAPCTTYCNAGEGGPNPYDCSAVASAIENQGGFTIPAGVTITFFTSPVNSCEAYIMNTSNEDQYYCKDNNNLAGVINYLAFNCQASSGGGPYKGGSCDFYDNTGIGWVEVQTRGA